MAQHNETGKWGEELATAYLKQQGYDILERDWRFGHRDIDIIVRSPDGRMVVFVEVKTRTSDVVTRPEDAIDLKKMRSIGLAANAYVKTFNIVDELRFDVISIVGQRSDTAQLEHIQDAFNPCLAYR